MKSKKSYSLFWRVVLAFYIVLLTVFVVVKFDGSIGSLISRAEGIAENRNNGYWNSNLTPFVSIKRYLRVIYSDFAITNLLGNVVAFVPLGFLMPLAFPKIRNFFLTIGFCIIIIFCVEMFQFVCMIGYFDVDDIILNGAGCIIGYLLYLAYGAVAKQA